MARILVIDDDPVFSGILSGILTEQGHSVTIAQDGLDGMKLFAKQGADLVVTDIIMPEQDGLVTIRAIRLISSTIPILAISAKRAVGRNGDYLRAAELLGANASLRQPFSPDQFLEAIDQLLGTGALSEL